MNPIFCDMDGVLSDFMGGCAKLYHARPAPERDPNRPNTEPLETIFGQDIWSRIQIAGPEFWEDLEPLPWAEELWALINTRSNGHAYLLTSPGTGLVAQHACVGKIRWCQKHLRVGTDRVILARTKNAVSQIGAPLLDDTDRQIDDWRARGGCGLLFPQPWNRSVRLCGTDPILYIKELLLDYGYPA